MKNLIMIMFCALCLIGCREEKKLGPIISSKIIVEPGFTKYQCEKCGKVSDKYYRIATTEGVSDYCIFCMKTLADKYLPKVKEIKEKT